MKGRAVAGIRKIGSELRVSSGAAGQEASAAATLWNGNFVVTWQDATGDGDGAGIKARIFSPDGKQVISEFTVNSQKSSTQAGPAIGRIGTGTGDDGFVVAWSSATGDSEWSGVKAQRFNASGAKVGEEFLVNSQQGGSQGAPAIAGLKDGGFVISWTDGNGGDSPRDVGFGSIRAQLYNAAGASVGTEFLVNTDGDSAQTLSSITKLSNDNFVITWQSDSGNGGDDGQSVRAQLYTPLGERLGTEFRVNTVTPGEQQLATVTALKKGFAVVWEDGSQGSSRTVQAQLFSDSGAKIGGQITVNTEAAYGVAGPTATALSDGSFVASWLDFNSPGGDLTAQVIGADGKKIGGNFTVNTKLTDTQADPAITALAGGGFAVSWTDGIQTMFGYTGTIRTQVFGVSRPLELSGDLKATVEREDSYKLTSADLGTLYADGKVSYAISGAKGGFVSLNGSDKAVTSFTQADLSAGKVTFVQAGSASSASFKVSAKDGDDTTAAKTFALSVTKPAPAAAAILAPKYDESGHALVSGLVSSQYEIMPLADGRSMIKYQASLPESQRIDNQMLDKNGVPTGTASTYLDPADLAERVLSISDVEALKDGRSLVFWNDGLSKDGKKILENQNIVKQVLDKDGKTISKEILVKDTPETATFFHGSEKTADGGFVASWTVGGTIFNDRPNEFMFQKLTAQGNKAGSAVKVFTTDDPLYVNGITALSDGRFFATWQTGDYDLWKEGDAELPQNWARLYTKDGKPAGEAFTVAPTNKNQSVASWLELSDGHVAAVWRDGDGALKMRQYDKGGKAGAVQVLEKQSTKVGAWRDIFQFGDGFVTVWVGSDEYVAQRFDNAGRPVGARFAVSESWGPYSTRLGWETAVLEGGDVLFSWNGVDNASGFNDKGEITADYPSGLKGRLFSLQTPVDGDNKANTLAGTSGDDRIKGLGGDDTLRGGAGDDVLIGGAGQDTLEGGGGIDTASYSTASKGIGLSLSRSSANAGDAAGDTFKPANAAFTDIERFVGSKFSDIMEGDSRGNHFDGGNGNDLLFGLAGDDTLLGAFGDDVLEGGAGKDRLDGGIGLDAASYFQAEGGVTASLRTPAANKGEAAGDTYVAVESLIGSRFADKLSGDSGRNRLDGNGGNDTLRGDYGDDFLFGDAGDDTLDGGYGDDFMSGDAGDDTLEGGYGADRLDGGAGSDTASYAEAAATKGKIGISASLLAFYPYDFDTGAAEGDTYVNIENLVGSDFDDGLLGDFGANRLTGGKGADSLGGRGGADTFVFEDVRDSGPDAATRDRIADFSVGDRIDLQAVTAKGFTFEKNIHQEMIDKTTLLVEVNTDGDAAFEMSIQLNDVRQMLSAGDFLL